MLKDLEVNIAQEHVAWHGGYEDWQQALRVWLLVYEGDTAAAAQLAPHAIKVATRWKWPEWVTAAQAGVELRVAPGRSAGGGGADVATSEARSVTGRRE